jgi:hypothetical protein
MEQKHLTWRELIQRITDSGTNLDDTASIQHPEIDDEVLCIEKLSKVDSNHKLYGVLDAGHLVLNTNWEL